MSESFDRQSVTRRRSALRLPKRRGHFTAAIAVIVLAIFVPVLALQWIGSDDDALSSGQVTVPDTPAPPVIAGIDREDVDLPDLLAGSVASDANPTETEPRVDALGNPIGDVQSAAQVPITRAVTPPPQSRAPLDADLTRNSRFGPIPGPDARGRTPLDVYKADSPSPLPRRPVALIIGGLGINGALTQRAINELPPEVTLSFAAHSPGLGDWIDRARRAGHEVLLEIPMESASFNPDEPGADRTLRPTDAQDVLIGNLHFLLSRSQGYAGLINYNGDLFLTRADAAARFLTEVEVSGLAFFTDGSFDTPTLPALAQSVDLPFKAGFGLIDPSFDRVVIDARLQNLSDAAASGDRPVGIGFAHPETLTVVKGWAATLSAEELTLVPATALLP